MVRASATYEMTFKYLAFYATFQFSKVQMTTKPFLLICLHLYGTCHQVALVNVTPSELSHHWNKRVCSNCAEHSGDWLHVPPITAIWLRLTDEMIQISGGTQVWGRNLGATYAYWWQGSRYERFAYRKSTARHHRHSHLNDIIWRAIKRAQIPALKKLVGLSHVMARDLVGCQKLTARDLMERHSI